MWEVLLSRADIFWLFCRHAVQLLSPASIMAKMNGRESICKVFTQMANSRIFSWMCQFIGAPFIGSVLIGSYSQGDLDEVCTLYLDAKSSARLLQEQQEKYITWFILKCYSIFNHFSRRVIIISDVIYLSHSIRDKMEMDKDYSVVNFCYPLIHLGCKFFFLERCKDCFVIQCLYWE